MSFNLYPTPVILLPEPKFGNQDTFDPRIVINRNTYGLSFGVLDDLPPVGHIQNLTFHIFDCGGLKATLLNKLYDRSGLRIGYKWVGYYFEGLVLDDAIDFVEDRTGVWAFTVSVQILLMVEDDDVRLTEDFLERLTEDGLVRVVE